MVPCRICSRSASLMSREQHAPEAGPQIEKDGVGAEGDALGSGLGDEAPEMAGGHPGAAGLQDQIGQRDAASAAGAKPLVHRPEWPISSGSSG